MWKATVLDFVGNLKLKASSVLSVQVWELCVWDRGALCLEETPQSPLEQLAVAFTCSCR